MKPRFAPIATFILLLAVLGNALLSPPKSPLVETSSMMPTLMLAPLTAPETSVQWKAMPDTVTMVNFFASWCMPCLAEHAQLKQIAAVEGIRLEGIAWNDSPKNLNAWLKKNGNPFTAVWLDTTGDATIDMGVRGVPESFVIDREGRVRLHLKGALMPGESDKVIALLTRLRDGETDAPAR